MILIEKQLPKPYVHYTQHSGTFIGFSDDEDSTIFFCTCVKSSIDNFVRLQHGINKPANANPLRNVTFDSFNFPEPISLLNHQQPELTLEQLSFANEICHRCLQKTPEKKYCAPMYGGKFKQAYGWYIRQNFFRVGVDATNKSNFLSDVCPVELQKLLVEVSDLRVKRNDHQHKVFPDADGINLGAINRSEWDVQRELEKQLSKRHRQVVKIIENLTREEFGFRKVGEQWVSETLLYQLVTQIFQGEDILRNVRPDWLGGLELDIYLPNLKLAFEYQGQQHYKPVKAWGGEKALKDLRLRDAKKKELCTTLGITLIEFKYTEDLSLSTLKKKLT